MRVKLTRTEPYPISTLIEIHLTFLNVCNFPIKPFEIDRNINEMSKTNISLYEVYKQDTILIETQKDGDKKLFDELELMIIKNMQH